jgi:hypothetical protein
MDEFTRKQKLIYFDNIAVLGVALNFVIRLVYLTRVLAFVCEFHFVG